MTGLTGEGHRRPYFNQKHATGGTGTIAELPMGGRSTGGQAYCQKTYRLSEGLTQMLKTAVNYHNN